MNARFAASYVVAAFIRALFAAAVALLPTPWAIAQTAAPLIDDEAYTHPQRMVQIERGRRINLYCLGSGSPTVVFDSGLAGETSDWGLVQPKIAPSTRTCSYDRAGIGFSDPARRAGSSINIVDDLHRLLVTARISPPYILVGHSYGGLNVRLFASRFPTEVIGMVLVEPQPEDWIIKDIKRLQPQWETGVFEPRLARQRACLAESLTGFKPDSELYKKCVLEGSDERLSDAINAAHLRLYARPAYQRALISEEECVFGTISGAQVRAARKGLGTMPLIVLTRSPDTSALAPNESAESRNAIYEAWVKRENEIASLSLQGMNRVIQDTGHYIQLSQPKAVTDAIGQVLDAAEEQQRKRGPSLPDR